MYRSPQFLIPLLFLMLMLALYPAIERFEFDSDEGLNLIKGQLIAGGHELYSTTWSDQPPLFSQCLALLYRFAGARVDLARFLVLFSSAVLLGSVWSIAVSAGGMSTGIATVLLLLTLPDYVVLSMSVMVGLPALSLASVSLAFLMAWHRHGRRRWLAVSGIALGLSVLTKLFTAILLPIILIGVILGARGRGFRSGWRPAVVWVGCFSVVVVGLSILWSVPEHLSQLIAPHYTSQDLDVYRADTVFRWIAESSSLLVLALVGGGYQMMRRRWIYLYPLGWMLLGLALLLDHHPVRYHHRLLYTVPAIILAGSLVPPMARAAIGWTSGGTLVARRKVGWLAVLVGVMLVGIQHWPAFVGTFSRTANGGRIPDSVQFDVVEAMREHAGPGDVVVTDRLMYAFRAGLNVPPHLAVISSKRLRTGALTGSDVLEFISRERPAVVLFERFKWESVIPWLDENYDSLASGNGPVLYLRREHP